MKIKLFFILFVLFIFTTAKAQMWNGKDTIYGNEWINYSQTYFKMKIANDGLYRLDYKDLTAAGIPLASLKGENFKVFALGKEIPVYVSNKNALQNADYLEFYGKKNRGELDAELYQYPNTEQMNPSFSMFNDTISYFLTWSAAAGNNINEIPNNLVNTPTKESYYMHRLDTTFVSFDLNGGGHDKPYILYGGDRISFSKFEVSEGFASIYQKSSSTKFILNGLVNNNVEGSLNVRLGLGQMNSLPNVAAPGRHSYEIKWNTNLLTKDSTFNVFSVRQYTLPIPNTQLSNISNLNIDCKNGVLDKHRIATIQVTYPKNFDFENKKSYTFEVASSTISKYIEVQNFNASNGNIVLYDFTNNIKITPLFENNLIKFVLPPSAVDRKLLLINTSLVQKTSVSAVNFVDFTKNKGNYIIVSHPSYYVDSKNGNKNWVQEYANYRASADGGNFQPIIVESQQLYDQFAYGIDRHDLSMRNFSLFAAKNWKPKFLFIIGKSLEYREARDPSYFKNFGNVLTVPTFGYPGSDNLITATKWSFVQKIAIGRLPVLEPEDIRIYLKKVKDYEQVQRDAQATISNKLWMKNIIHLAGTNKGGNTQEVGALLGMENVITKNKFGGKVTTFYKTSSDPVQSSNSEAMRLLLREGVSIVNFYGHSSAQNLAYALDAPSELQNKNRYFYFLAHGCYSGQVHVPQKTIGPTYIFQEDAGAIAFSAPTSFGLTGKLDDYGKAFYAQLGGASYGKGVGEVIKNAISDVYGLSPDNNVLNIMTLQGDPAVKLNPSKTPDYTIDLASIKFEPEIVSTLTERFKLNYTAYNVGRNDDDVVSVSLIRELPNGTKILVKKDTIKGLIRSQELSFDIQGLGEYSAGKNKFYLKIDADNKVIELPAAAEANNEVNDAKGVDFYIQAIDVNLLSPTLYAIVNQPTVMLKAIPANVLAKTQKYIFEIDTSANFNSSFKQRKEIIQSGGILSWTPSLTHKDSTVYYWRVSPDSTAKNPFAWRTNSYVYLKNSSEGWNQSHFFQFLNNDFKFMDLLKKDRRFNYQGNSTGIVIKNSFGEISRPSVGINDHVSGFLTYAMLQTDQAGVICWVFNDTTGLAWVSRTTDIATNISSAPKYNANINAWTYAYTDYFFPYPTSSKAGRSDLIKFLDTIPSKSYVVFMAVAHTKKASYKPELWAADSVKAGDRNLFNILEKQGAKMPRQMLTTPKKNGVNAYPYFYFFRKDDPTFVGTEQMTNPDFPDKTISLSVDIKGNWYKGAVKSTVVGPASKWSAVHWKLSETEVQDTCVLNVYGIKKNNKDTLLYKKIKQNNLDISSLNTLIYPKLRLEWTSKDSVKRTTPQLKYWRVLYDGVPEAVPNAAKNFTFKSDTLQEGQRLELSLAAENVSKYNMKDLLVKYTVKKANNSQVSTYQKLEPLLQNDTLMLRYSLDTKTLVGQNSLTVQLNPNENQPEQDTSNNLAFLNFYVEKDKRNPNLDVTFDGQRIINGDIISPEPNIVIEMKDENKYALLDDTSLFRVAIRYPDDSKARPIAFDGVNMKFFPAKSTNNNRATIEMSPKFLKDGDYQLLVRSNDVAGNKTTNYELADKDKGNPDFYNFKIAFKVLTKSSISNVLNYPNPFTTSTRFVYTLTGKEPPVYFKIQIMTMSGKVVRELTQNELGPLRTGTHQTEQAWDGTDTYGDRLANGVYLYKMIAKKATGEDYESYESGADQFMKNGVGKLVILR